MPSLSYDLHCHSTCSDGLLTPAALVARAAERGVNVLALTDHDETSGLDEAEEAARARGIALVTGVEISVTWAGHTLHVVGLCIRSDAPSLRTGLARLREGRSRRAERIAAGLDAIGIPGALEGARRYVGNPELVSRTHFARFLVEQGHARDMQSVFRRYLGSGQPGHVTHQWATLEDAVAWIIDAGGIAVLAHPGRYKIDVRERDELLARFKALGGGGIEVASGAHTAAQLEYWAKHAQRHDLLASCGSDFHGPGESYRDLGALPAMPAGCTPVWQRF